MSDKLAEMAKQIEALEAENARLVKNATKAVTLKVSEKGAVSVYGMGRFPVTLYQEQWLKLLGMSETITAFISTHADVLELKGDDEATKAAKAARRVTTSAPPAGPAAPKTTVAPSVKVNRVPARG